MEPQRATQESVSKELFESELRLLKREIENLSKLLREDIENFKRMFFRYEQDTAKLTVVEKENINERLDKMNQLREEFSDMKGRFAEITALDGLRTLVIINHENVMAKVQSLKEEIDKILNERYVQFQQQFKLINDELTSNRSSKETTEDFTERRNQYKMSIIVSVTSAIITLIVLAIFAITFGNK